MKKTTYYLSILLSMTILFLYCKKDEATGDITTDGEETENTEISGEST